MPQDKLPYEVLYTSKWAEVRKRGFYVYTHSPWSNSMGVALLPFRFVNGQIQFLARFENNLAHTDNRNELEICSITGGYDNADRFTIEECALNELREEGGYAALPVDLIPLGTANVSKGSDYVQFLYGIDLGKPHIVRVEPTGDGTEGEIGAYCKWVTREELFTTKDPLVYMMYARLFLR